MNIIEKDFVLEYNLKFEMFKKCLPEIKKHLIKKKSKFKKIIFTKKIIEDSIIAIKDIQEKNDFNYYHAFILCLSLGFEYKEIADKIKNKGEFLHNIRNEEYWDIGIIDINESIFFSYTFLNEVYRRLNIDFHKLNNSSNLENDYYILRNKIIDQSKKL